jgi:hypothetical protein
LLRRLIFQNLALLRPRAAAVARSAAFGANVSSRKAMLGDGGTPYAFSTDVVLHSAVPNDREVAQEARSLRIRAADRIMFWFGSM